MTLKSKIQKNLDKLIFYFIPEKLQGSESELLRGRLLVVSNWLVVFVMGLIFTLRQFFGSEHSILQLLVFGTFIIFESLTPWVLKKTENLNYAALWSIFPLYLVVTLGFFSLGGVQGPALMLLPIVVVMAVLYGGDYLGTRVLFFSALYGAVLSWTQFQFGPFENSISDIKDFSLFQTFLLLFMLSWVYILTSASERVRQHMSFKYIEDSKHHTLGNLSAGIAHEINNPLTVIQCQISTLKRKLSKENSELLTQVEKIEPMIERISKVTTSLIKYSGDCLKTELSVFDLKTAIDQAVLFYRERAQNQNVQLKLNLTNEDINLKGDKNILNQSLLCVFDNALDAIYEEQEKSIEKIDKWIEVHTNLKGDFAEISIINSGPKISKEIRSKIFTPFFTTKTRHNNSGIGLSLCQGLLLSIGGKIYEDSKIKNTCFTIRVPAFKNAEKSTEPAA